MKLKTQILKLTLLTALLCFCYGLNAQSISASGSWTPSVTTITEAGNSYASGTIQSGTSQTLISVTMPAEYLLVVLVANNWKVQIKRTDTGPSLDAAGLAIYAMRTGPGSGGGTGLLGVPSAISGGDSVFQQITTSNADFFQGYHYGNATRSSIPVQYQITGISVLVPAASYTVTITYTLVDN